MQNIKKFATLCIIAMGLASSLNASSASVYSKTCAKCHGKTAEGNEKVPDAPALSKLTKEELVAKLSDIKKGGIENNHEKMAANQKVLEHRGIKYDTNEMASYISGLGKKK
ncbi:MAG: hypothetical protein PHE67_13950 [Campylobacterales bacterium]|jgi:cytochrome c553|nr:hypothetical protein [Campylobacterales bacterium]